MQRKIPVFGGPRVVDFCDEAGAQRYVHAKNAQVIRERKSGEIVRINLVSFGDDSGERSHGQVNSVYEEHLEAGNLNVLAIAQHGTLRRWGANDAFNPRRFNPDMVPS